MGGLVIGQQLLSREHSILLKTAPMMTTTRIFLLLLDPSSLLALKMDLYYESLCPDSTRFISNQIPEMWAALSQEVSINFVPYGFASTTEDEDGELHFECQHGDRECAGNIVQACSLPRPRTPRDRTAGSRWTLTLLLLRSALWTVWAMCCTQPTGKRLLELQTHPSPTCPGPTLTVNILRAENTGRLKRLVFLPSFARSSHWLAVPLQQLIPLKSKLDLSLDLYSDSDL